MPTLAGHCARRATARSIRAAALAAAVVGGVSEGASFLSIGFQGWL